MNKIINLLSVSLFLCCSSLTIAQNITWGVMNSAVDSWYKPTILGQTIDGTYTTLIRGVDYYVEKHGTNGQNIFTECLKLPDINKMSSDLEYISFSDDKFIVFVSVFDSKKDQSILYSLTYSSENAKQTGEPKKVFEVPVEKQSRKGEFYFFSSKDGSKLLINHYAYYKKEGKYKDRYRLFDSQSNLLVERDEVIERNSTNYRTFNYIINNDGTFFFVKSYSEGENYIVSYDASSDYEKWEERIDLSQIDRNEVIENLRFDISDNNDLIVTGFNYEKDEKQNKSLKGVMFMKVNSKSKEVEVQKIVYDDFFKDYSDFSMSKQSILFCPDGTVVLTAEVISRLYAGGGTQLGLLDVVALKFNDDGTLAWKKAITKRQEAIFSDQFPYSFFSPSARHLDYWSFTPGILGNNLVVIYNDKPKNYSRIKRDDFSKMRHRQNVAPVLCSIDLSTGEITRSKLFNPKTEKIYLKTVFWYQKDYKSDIIVMGQKGHKYRFGKLQQEKASADTTYKN